MESAVYTLGASGLKRLSEHPELPKGTIVYAFGAFMEESRWATTGKGEEVVKLSENDSESYFSKPFHNLDKYCRPISEKFGIGFYYDLNAPRATDEEINQAIERGEQVPQRGRGSEKASRGKKQASKGRSHQEV